MTSAYIYGLVAFIGRSLLQMTAQLLVDDFWRCRIRRFLHSIFSPAHCTACASRPCSRADYAMSLPKLLIAPPFFSSPPTPKRSPRHGQKHIQDLPSLIYQYISDEKAEVPERSPFIDAHFRHIQDGEQPRWCRKEFKTCHHLPLAHSTDMAFAPRRMTLKKLDIDEAPRRRRYIDQEIYFIRT